MNESYNQTPPPHTASGGPSDWVPPAAKQGPPVGAKFFQSIRTSGFYRSEERWIGGVAGGLGRKYGIDPLIVRVAIVLLACLWGGGIIFYAAAWALLPEQRDGRIHLEEAIRGNFNGAQLLIAAMVLVGFSATGVFFIGAGFLPPFFEAFFWIAVTAALIVSAIVITSRNKTPSPSFGAKPPPSTSPDAWGMAGPTDWGTSHQPDPAEPAQQTPNNAPVTSTAPFTGTTPTAFTEPVAWDNSASSYGAPVSGGYYGASPQPGTAAPASPQATYTWTPPKPAKPPVKHPGAAQFGILLGLLFLGAAALLFLNQSGAFVNSLEMVGVLSGLALTLGGLTVIINGFMGRTSGAAGLFGILGFLAAIATSGAFFLGIGPIYAQTDMFTDRVATPASISEISEGFVFGAGDYTLDLTDLDLSSITAADAPITIPISGGAGQIDIIMPTGLAMTADLNLVAGSIVVADSDEQLSSGGLGNFYNAYQSPAVTAGAAPSLHLEINMAAGEIRFTEGD